MSIEKGHNLKTRVILVVFSFFIMAMEPASGIEFNSLIELADQIVDVEFNLIDTVSMGGTTITDLHAHVISSSRLDLSKYEMLGDDENVLFSVLVDGANGKVYYNMDGVVVEAPPNEAQDSLGRMHRFYELRPLYESGCDVYDSGATTVDGRSVHVYNLYNYGAEPPRWHRVFVDSETGMMFKGERYDGEILRTRQIHVTSVNSGVQEKFIWSEFSLSSYPVMSIKQLVSGEKPPAASEDISSTSPAASNVISNKDAQESRLARVNATIARLPTVIESNGNQPRFYNLLAAAYCSRAFYADSVSDADQSISIYRSLLAKPDLPEFDQVESMLGLARACLCKAFLMPVEREKMEMTADSILQKLLNDENLDPILRNIAGQFSMRWEEAKLSGRPQDVIDWFDWMEEIRKVER